MEADEILEENSIIGRKCEIKTADLDQQINLRFFDTLERLDREFPSVPGKTSLDQIFGNDYDAKEKISSYLQAFSQGVMTLLQQDNFEINAHLKTNLKVEESTFGSQEEDEEMDKESFSQFFQLQVEGNALRAIPLDFGNSNNAHQQSFPDIIHLKKVEFFHIGSKNVHFTEKHSDILKHLHSKCNQIWKLYFCLKSKEFTDEDLTHFCSDFFWATYKIRTFSFNLKNTGGVHYMYFSKPL